MVVIVIVVVVVVAVVVVVVVVVAVIDFIAAAVRNGVGNGVAFVAGCCLLFWITCWLSLAVVM